MSPLAQLGRMGALRRAQSPLRALWRCLRSIGADAALISASKTPDERLIRDALARGADPLCRSDEGAGCVFLVIRSLCHLGASARDCQASLEALLSAGASPRSEPSRLAPALHCAAQSPKASALIVAALLSAGAAPNQASSELAFTALHCLCDESLGAEEKIELLLSFGANPELKNSYGETAQEFFRRCGQTRCAGALAAALARREGALIGSELGEAPAALRPAARL